MGTTEHHYHKEICTNHINIVGGAKREETQWKDNIVAKHSHSLIVSEQNLKTIGTDWMQILAWGGRGGLQVLPF